MAMPAAMQQSAAIVRGAASARPMIATDDHDETRRGVEDGRFST
jgi:hypothetical protein